MTAPNFVTCTSCCLITYARDVEADGRCCFCVLGEPRPSLEIYPDPHDVYLWRRRLADQDRADKRIEAALRELAAVPVPLVDQARVFTAIDSAHRRRRVVRIALVLLAIAMLIAAVILGPPWLLVVTGAVLVLAGMCLWFCRVLRMRFGLPTRGGGR